LQQLPSLLAGLQQLQLLYMQSCAALTGLPAALPAALQQLQVLALHDCSSLTSLPETLGNFSHLQELSLRDCPRLLTLPESFGQLQQLKTLSIRNCRGLKALPESLGDLTILQVLDLQDCCGLAALPESCSQLSRLHTLQIGGTGIATAEEDEVGLWEGLVALFRHGVLEASSRPGSRQQSRAEVQQRLAHILRLQGDKMAKEQQQQQRRKPQLQWSGLSTLELQHSSVLLVAAAASFSMAYLAARAVRVQQSR
jgi:hypothetical protein